mmetsp:Transcript_3378/g.4975  ORF Transcript_3378/g.4975 Transcript_3378/m.4975 type:complete len:83 (+) Transcript_3378:96-344(+)
MGENLSPEQQQAVIQRLRSEVQAQALQDLVQKMTEKCHSKCCSTSGAKLDRSEQQCLAVCMDRYLDTMGMVNKAIAHRSNSR